MLDMNGNTVCPDELLFADNGDDVGDVLAVSASPPAPGAETLPRIGALPEQEKTQIFAILKRYRAVFEEKMHPDKAKVEPMSIKQKPDWIPPNPEPDRRYAPKVLTAMQYDLQRQLELGVVE